MKKITLLFCFIIISCKVLFAIPAFPKPITFTQPNGDTLTICIKGDERIHWNESLDGYTLLCNQNGYLTYAQLDEDGNLQSSDYIATNIGNRSFDVETFLRTIEKKLFYSDIQKQLMLKVWQIEDEASAQYQLRGDSRLSGQYKTLCAFVQFPEKSFTKTMSQFEGLLNQLGYTGNGTGSVRDYFKEASYNQFDLIITLCGIYTAPNSESYYAGSSGAANCPALARWAAQQVAAESTINFADYDSDNNGTVDGFHFIFAGEGQEATGNTSLIWSHKSSFSPAVTKNGKSISTYSCSPELLWGSITTMGVIAHEMSHAWGAADFYDTNYETGGLYDGTGEWDIMADGSWNENGNRPPHHNMYVKVQYGWVIPTVLSSAATITNMPNAAQNAVAYRINTATTNEYFLLENRQKLNFDSSIPGNGLIIYRVHSQIGSAGNAINATHPQKMYPVCASSTVSIPTSTPSSYGTINSAGCPFPGSSNKTSFTDATTPSMKSWANANTNKPITNITHVNRLISFDFMGGGTSNCDPVTNLAVNYTTDCKANLTWNAPAGKGDDTRAVLWDNTNINTQNYGQISTWWATGGSGCILADDFDVTTNWSIEKITVNAFYGPSSTAPATMGVKIFSNNSGVPGTEIYSNNSLPVSVSSNIYTINLPTPFAITATGKYWISVYGVYNTAIPTTQPELVQRIFYVLFGANSIGLQMKSKDYANLFGQGTDWANIAEGDDGGPVISMYFKIEGTSSSSGTTAYNIYRDGASIATNITTTSYTDQSFTATADHTWSVKVACAGGGESYPTSVTKDACQQQYTITTSAGSNGKISPSGTITVNKGASQTFTFTPNSGYEINQVLVDGSNNPGAVTNKSYTFTNVTANHTISVTFKATFVPVTNITDLPSEATAGTALTLTGTVVPSNATNKTITWSIVSAGTTGATISGSTFNATAVGTATVKATIVNGLATGSNYTRDFNISVKIGFVPVTNITDLPSSATVGIPLTLTGTVVPSNATNKTITWNILSAGNTGATLSDNIFNATAAGTATMRATIVNGFAVGSDYTKDFNIKVTGVGINEFTQKSGITVFPNPTTGILNLIQEGIEKSDVRYEIFDIEIFDIYGRKLISDIRYPISEIGKSEIEISISHLPAGIYFLKIDGQMMKVIKN